MGDLPVSLQRYSQTLQNICEIQSLYTFITYSGLTDVLAESRDYNELLGVWKGWRDQTGKLMRTKYTEFVNVMNEAIKFSGKLTLCKNDSVN